MTFASSFTGFGGADLGAHAAGLRSVWGVEIEDKIAAVARANDLPVTTGDVLTSYWGDREIPTWYHTSPPCPSFSVAKTGGGETEADLALADAVALSIRVLRAPWVSLENVRGYEDSESFRRILAALDAAGYRHVRGVLMAADYGVPQTRERLVLVASLVGKPRLPVATHAKVVQGPDLFGETLLPWNGWYAAVEDLLDALPDSKLADWQIKRLPADLRETVLVAGTSSMEVRGDSLPAATVVATVSGKAAPPRAVLVHGADVRSMPVVPEGDPAFTVLAGNVTSATNRPRALLMAGAGNTSDVKAAPGVGVSESDEPAQSVYANPGAVRAVLVESAQSGSEWGDGTREIREPSRTITAHDRPSHAPRAILVDGGSAFGGSVQHATEDEPAFVVKAGTGSRQMARAMLQGVRVVQLSPRCLARFQSFPDAYLIPGDGLPGSNGLACKGIGNAVPPLMMQRVIEANLR